MRVTLPHNGRAVRFSLMREIPYHVASRNACNSRKHDRCCREELAMPILSLKQEVRDRIADTDIDLQTVMVVGNQVLSDRVYSRAWVLCTGGNVGPQPSHGRVNLFGYLK